MKKVDDKGEKSKREKEKDKLEKELGM